MTFDVGVGVGVGCIRFAVAAFIYLRRRLYARTASAGAQNQKREAGELAAQQRFHELVTGRGQLDEMPAKDRPQELPTER